MIPKILNSIKRKKKKVYIYGSSYKTIDGTCIRDYVHVNDIVRAHYYGLKKFRQKKCVLNYNIGSGKGYSVLEIIKGIEKVTKVKLKIVYRKKYTNKKKAMSEEYKLKKNYKLRSKIKLKFNKN